MRTLISLFAGAAVLLSASLASATEVKLEDPKGDDFGPGNYTYPTDPVYTNGSFDLREVVIEEDGDTIEVSVTVGTKIEDPWDSKAWEGNGFSVQMAFLFIDTDHVANSGHKDALPGLNVKFADESAWDKVLILSPQGNRRVQAEINEKAKAVKGDIVLPTSIKARGKKLVAKFKKSEVGAIKASWGYQLLLQSNEGFPDKTDLLTRKVNEYGGQHRFGGGNDYDCDPHVMDMLAGGAKGESAEKDAQKQALGTFKCDASGKGQQAVLPMVYPGG